MSVSSDLKYDAQGIVRNHNGFPAFCPFVKDYCLKPYCLRCSSYQEPKYEPRPKFDADADLFNYLVLNSDALELTGSATKKWFKAYKAETERQLRNCIEVS